MLDINKEELQKKYQNGDMTYFFNSAKKITDYILSRNYKIFDVDIREDMTQECLLNLWKKIEQGKVDGSKNLMAFIWTNSNFRILEIFRKENNRNRIAQFISIEEFETDAYQLNIVNSIEKVTA